MVFAEAEANVIHSKIKSYHQICCGVSPNPVIRKDPGLNRDRFKSPPTNRTTCLPVGFSAGVSSDSYRI